MPPQRYEIYWAAIPFRDCNDGRPWVVVSDPYPDDKVTVYPTSSQFDFCRPSYFVIPDDDPGFASTGLAHRSYVIDDYPVSAPFTILDDKRGELTGALLDEFREWNFDV